MSGRSSKGRAAGVARAVAASVDVPTEALEILPELFADLDALGTATNKIVELVGRHLAEEEKASGIGHRALGEGRRTSRAGGGRPRGEVLAARALRVVDLGCGKGAFAVAAAGAWSGAWSGALGARVLGIDGFGPFVREARRAARAAGVGPRCRFRVGDVRVAPGEREAGSMDVGVMLSVMPAARGRVVLRRWVRPGGLMVLDDAVTVDARYRHPERPPTAAAMRAMLERGGDRVVAERIVSASEARREERALQRAIAARARRLREVRLELADVIDEVLDRQREAAGLLCGPVRGATWVLRRG